MQEPVFIDVMSSSLTKAFFVSRKSLASVYPGKAASECHYKLNIAASANDT